MAFRFYLLFGVFFDKNIKKKCLPAGRIYSVCMNSLPFIGHTHTHTHMHTHLTSNWDSRKFNFISLLCGVTRMSGIITSWY